MNFFKWKMTCFIVLALLVSPCLSVSAVDDELIVQLSSAFREAIEQVRPAVVSIGAERDSTTVGEQWEELEQEHDGLPDFFKKFLPEIEEYRDEVIPRRGWQGSGVIISPTGEILTNNHVIANADSLTITLDDGRDMEAEIISTDKETDLALIQLKGEGPFPHAMLGDSDLIQVGDWVLAIGNPFGLSQSVSEGIISAKGRTSTDVPVGAVLADYIQTTAAINPGNSGGPLINLYGEVIGINNSIQTAGVPANLGIGFAIPSVIAKKFVKNIHEFGTVKRGAIGIELAYLPDEVESFKEKYGISYGALIKKVMPGFPADEAGLQSGDVILEINGKKVRDHGHLIYMVSMLSVDTPVEVTILRDGERMAKEMMLTDRTKVIEVAQSEHEKELEEQREKEAEEESTPEADLGVDVETLTPELAKENGFNKSLKGVLIKNVKPGSPAERYGLEAGDVIAEMENQSIAGVEEYKNILNEAQQEMKKEEKSEQVIMLYVYRAGSRYHPKYVAPTIGRE
ncbi:PDZ domain-containing protein [bacterium]|nr:PDZ domain-containing protein [bacterium]